MSAGSGTSDGRHHLLTRPVLALVVWTMLLLAVAVLVAGEAASSLYAGQQACYLDYPAVACPSGADPAVVRLTLAFFVVPAVWLIGIGVAIVASLARRRRPPA
jgi:hypothetical protein